MKKINIPHTFTIVFFIIIACAVMTWIIPGGEFERQTVQAGATTKSVVVSNSYHAVAQQPQTWQVFTSFFRGFERSANIIVFILMIGGAFWILNATNAINVGIHSFINFTERLHDNKLLSKIGVNNIVITLIMLMFSLFGAIFGMSEETIAFVGIFVPLAISMGYDTIVGVLMCYVAAHVGFAGAIFNPFTLGIAQGLSGLAPFSGLEYRVICWVIFTASAIAFTLFYAAKVKKNPKLSFMYEHDLKRNHAEESASSIPQVQETDVPAHSAFSRSALFVYLAVLATLIYCSFAYFSTSITIGNASYSLVLFPVLAVSFAILGALGLRSSVHNFILTLLLLTIIILVIGVLGFGWYVTEIAGLFFAMGLSAGIAFGINFDRIMRLFLDGCKDIMNAALVVGIAGGIIIILEDGKIIDTVLYAVSQVMNNTGREGSLATMYAIQNALNIIIPSGSAKATLTIPIMAEFSDIVQISRQTTVLAFQFGDGFTNMLTPNSGVLIGVLGVAGIPYAKWAKFILPYVVFLIIIGFLLLLPTLYFGINGF